MTNYQKLTLKRLRKDSEQKIENAIEQMTKLCKSLGVPTSTSMVTMLENAMTCPLAHIQDRDNAIAIYSNFVSHYGVINITKELTEDE